MGRCDPRNSKGGCGQAHPPIELPADSFPDDLPWQQMVVLPPGEGSTIATCHAGVAALAAGGPPGAATSRLCAVRGVNFKRSMPHPRSHPLYLLHPVPAGRGGHIFWPRLFTP